MPVEPLESTNLPPTPAAIRDVLQHILASREFATAARSRRFLSYVVEQTISGQQDAVKEVVLGIEVFDRSTTFDPRIDPIVRVEAGKLRKRLQEYYETEGADDPVLIQVSKGSYVPTFQVREAVPAAQPTLHPPLRWKHAAAALALVIIGAIAYFGTRALRKSTPAASPSIAVLPFLNLSPDPSNEYFADGLAEDLTDALVGMGGIRVASRTSAFSFKGRQADAHDIGTKLRVVFLVEGSVRKEGQRLKVTAQLVRTDNGYHVWSHSFERDMKEVLTVQQEIAQLVACALEPKITPGRGGIPERAHTANVQAFDLYLKGRHAVTTPAPVGIDAAERLFLDSIAADPTYARPHLALAQLYLSAEIMGLRRTPELVGKAKEAVQQALALDGGLAEAHAVLGSLTARHEYDLATAELQMREALRLDPNSALAHNQLALNVLAPQGRWDEATAEIHRAIELDPYSPEITVGAPWLLYLQRRTGAALESFRKLAAATPSNPAALIGLGSALEQNGDYQGAIDVDERLQKLGPSPVTLAYLGYCHARSGRVVQAQRILLELTQQSHTRPVSPFCFAVVYAGLQDRDHAFQYLENARKEQSSSLLFIRISDEFASLRADPRFATLLAELRLRDADIQRNQSFNSGAYR